MRLVPIGLGLVLVTAASAQVTAPLLGWLPEGTQIRPMNGLSAAATLGPPAKVGSALTHIAVSPSQDYVLASEVGTGVVRLIIPGVSAITLDTSVKPDQIVTSPRGSSATLWFSATAQFEILTGLPTAPRLIRQIDASFLKTALAGIAVSDDGQWIAAASSAGVYEWGPDGVPHQLYGGGDAGALAFFAGSSSLAIATSNQLLSIAEFAGSVLYQGSFSPAGLATTFDDREIVLADQNGTIYSIDAATNTPSITDCHCRPSGVFGLGGSVFRLTDSSIGPVKLFDAASGATLAIPGNRFNTRRSARPAQATATLPTLTINLNPTPTGYLQQPALTISASSAYSSEIDGNVTLTFASNSSTGGTDQTIQFSSGGTTANFTIPAGSTQANFSGASSVTFSTGTVAGTITLAANVTAPTSASAVATRTVTTNSTWPLISNVQLSPSTGGVTVVVTGFSSTDDMISGSFEFALSSNATILQNDIGVPLSPVFQPWYAASSSYATGSAFSLTVPFTVAGNAADLVGVTVTLLNSKGASNPVSSK